MGETTKIGFYSSMLFSIPILIIDICYLILFTNPNPWVDLERYAANYSFIELLSETIGFILLPTFLITINGIILIITWKAHILQKLVHFLQIPLLLLFLWATLFNSL